MQAMFVSSTFKDMQGERDALHRLDDALNQMNRLCRTEDDAAQDGARI